MTTKTFLLREAVVRYSATRQPAPPGWGDRRIEQSSNVFDIFGPMIEDRLVEAFWTIALDSKNRVIGYCQVSEGSVSFCPVTPSDVFRFLVLSGASGVVFMHNHPSGDSMPSADDVALTDRLVRAGEMLWLRVLDHVIIGEGSFFSFLDAGLIGAKK